MGCVWVQTADARSQERGDWSLRRGGRSALTHVTSFFSLFSPNERGATIGCPTDMAFMCSKEEFMIHDLFKHSNLYVIPIHGLHSLTPQATAGRSVLVSVLPACKQEQFSHQTKGKHLSGNGFLDTTCLFSLERQVLRCPAQTQQPLTPLPLTVKAFSGRLCLKCIERKGCL